MNTLIFTLVAASLASAASYALSAWFWNTEYSRTNHSGDGGGPAGGVWCTFGGTAASLILLAKFWPSYIPADHAIWVLGLVAASSFIAGFVPLFRNKR